MQRYSPPQPSYDLAARSNTRALLSGINSAWVVVETEQVLLQVMQVGRKTKALLGEALKKRKGKSGAEPSHEEGGIVVGENAIRKIQGLVVRNVAWMLR